MFQDSKEKIRKCKVKQKVQMIRKNNAITLISLIITVIVLLILAGVTLSLTLRRKRYI